MFPTLLKIAFLSSIAFYIGTGVKFNFCGSSEMRKMAECDEATTSAEPPAPPEPIVPTTPIPPRLVTINVHDERGTTTCIGVLIDEDIAIANKTCLFPGQVPFKLYQPPPHGGGPRLVPIQMLKHVSVSTIAEDTRVAHRSVSLYFEYKANRGCVVESRLVVLKLPQAMVPSDSFFPVISEEESKRGYVFVRAPLSTTYQPRDVKVVKNSFCEGGNSIPLTDGLFCVSGSGMLPSASPYIEIGSGGQTLAGVLLWTKGNYGVFASTTIPTVATQLREIVAHIRTGGWCGTGKVIEQPEFVN